MDNQRAEFKRLGVTGTWDNPYLTLKPEFEAEQIRVFGKMAENGYIYKGLKPIYWSPSSESSLAEAEIEYKDVESPSIYVAFKVKRRKRRCIRGCFICHLDNFSLDTSSKLRDFRAS